MESNLIVLNRQSRVWKVLAFGGLVLGLLALVLGTANLWLSPLLSDRVSAIARQRFGSELHFQSLTVSLFPHVSVNATGVVFRQNGATDVPPLFAIDRVEVEAGLAGLVGPYRRAHRITFHGLRITVPPRRAGADQLRVSEKKSADRFLADEIVANGTRLTILPRAPGKEPLVFDIQKLTLYAGSGASMHYQAQLMNAKPPGLIQAEGDFGPWLNDDPGGTPLNGHYTFSHADLSVFNGISGFLSSTGHFAGNLQNINAEGTTDTPDFALRDAGHPVHLVADYKAVIDGTNGQTLLQPVNAQFRHTHIVCRGGIVQKPGEKAKTVDLDGTVKNGRLEDVLYLATRSKQPMTGVLNFTSKIIIPPGNVDVVKKLQLAGNATVQDMLFTNPGVQQKLNGLSNRAQGHPKAGDTGNIPSALTAKFSMNEGTIQFASLTFTIPGAQLFLTGSYGILNEGLDFKGEARTEAKPSQMTTGIKSVLLKAVDPFVAKQGAGAVLPVHIGGTREHPMFGL